MTAIREAQLYLLGVRALCLKEVLSLFPGQPFNHVMAWIPHGPVFAIETMPRWKLVCRKRPEQGRLAHDICEGRIVLVNMGTEVTTHGYRATGVHDGNPVTIRREGLRSEPFSMAIKVPDV